MCPVAAKLTAAIAVKLTIAVAPKLTAQIAPKLTAVESAAADSLPAISLRPRSRFLPSSRSPGSGSLCGRILCGQFGRKMRGQFARNLTPRRADDLSTPLALEHRLSERHAGTNDSAARPGLDLHIIEVDASRDELVTIEALAQAKRSRSTDSVHGWHQHWRRHKHRRWHLPRPGRA